MIPLTLLQFYGASPAVVARRSGSQLNVTHADQEYVCMTWCRCAAVEVAVMPRAGSEHVDVLVVCAEHPDTPAVRFGQRLPTKAEREAEYAQAAAVRRQLAVDFSVRHRPGVIAWGDPHWSKPQEQDDHA